MNLTTLLESALSKRKGLLAITNAIRLVNGKGDGLEGLVIEQYSSHFVIHIYKHGWQEKISTIEKWIKNRFDPQYLVLKYRLSPDGRVLDNPKADILLDKAGSKAIVNEYDMKFLVDLNDGVNSGLFLDMRHNRKMLGELAKGKKVLNCFAYTCSFGVHCRVGKALQVQNVDISAKVLKRGEENYKLNSLTADSQEFIRMEAELYLEKAIKHKNFYDLIILDPPSFARNQEKVFQVKKNLPKLLEKSIKVLKPQGILFVSTNYSGLTIKHIIQMLQKSSLVNRKTIKSISSSSQDRDFPSPGGIKESSLACVLAKMG